MKQLLISTCISASLFVTGCGGGGGDNSDNNSGGGITLGTTYSGLTSPATATDDNAEELAVAAVEGSIRAAAAIDNPLAIETHAAPSAQNLLLDVLLQQEIDSVTGATEVENGSCGGSFTLITPDMMMSNGVYHASYTLNDYCIGGHGISAIFNGHATIQMQMAGGEMVRNITMMNITYTYYGLNETFTTVYTGTIDCSYSGDNETCTEYDNFNGVNGHTYRIEHASGNRNNLSVRVYDAQLGYIGIEATNLGYACNNGNFSSGSIAITDSTGTEVISLSFPNCNEMVLTYQNVASVYPQLFD